MVLDGMPGQTERTVITIGFFDAGRTESRYTLDDYRAAFDLVLPAGTGGFTQLAELLLGADGDPLSPACLELVGGEVQRALETHTR